MKLTTIIAGIAFVFGTSLQAQEVDYLSSEWQHGDNTDYSRSWYANPQIDLPWHNQDYVNVYRPLVGGVITPQISWSDELSDQLDGYHRKAFDRLVWHASNQALLQWSRHLQYDPGTIPIQIGYTETHICGENAAGCASNFFYNLEWQDDDHFIRYQGVDNAGITLKDEWIKNVYRDFRNGNKTRAYQRLLSIITHEAGHLFHYENPNGEVNGCNSNTFKCHADDGSRSVMSYDLNKRYAVTKTDVRHIPHATWNNNDHDVYQVIKTGGPDSIYSWGNWIAHEFDVNGYATRQLSGGNLDVEDGIWAKGWIVGEPSENVQMTGSATYSGTDNFLGVDLDENYLGALLRADANLRYTFDDQNMHLRVNNFEAHYARGDNVATWHKHSFSTWGNFTYDMDCSANGCTSESVETKWYANDAGDMTGWVGGVVSDSENEYVGSFVAEKD